MAQLSAALALIMSLSGCSGNQGRYHSFADHPGFSEYYSDRCREGDSPATEARDQELLSRHRPRIVLPPGGLYPIDFYRDYLPHTVMRTWPVKEIVHLEVTRDILVQNLDNREVFLDFQLDRYREAGLERRLGEALEIPLEERRPIVYGRVYREQVTFQSGKDGVEKRRFTFLKYNLLFPYSGLPADLSTAVRLLLRLNGFDPENWHELDNFVAIHIVLDEGDQPVAVVLAQHNHHRTYLVGRDMAEHPGGRFVFDVALRSNEVYPDSGSSEPVNHRVVRSSLYLGYLISGENPPWLQGNDVTRGVNAGGREIDYDLVFLSPCDPLYTARILLGEPRPFWWGIYLGRDGPPGSDYYNIPQLLPMGNLLKFGYLQDGDQEDIAVVRKAIDPRSKSMDIDMILDHGGGTFLEDWRELQTRRLGDDATGRKNSLSR